MLQKNPLLPPVPFRPRSSAGIAGPFVRVPLAAAEDFDATGILVGMDPSASRYWWLPELYGPDTAGGIACGDRAGEAAQATSRAGGAPPAAA